MQFDHNTSTTMAFCSDSGYPNSIINGYVGNFWCKQYDPSCKNHW